MEKFRYDTTQWEINPFFVQIILCYIIPIYDFWEKLRKLVFFFFVNFADFQLFLTFYSK